MGVNKLSVVCNCMIWAIVAGSVTLFMAKVTKQRGDKYYEWNRMTISAFVCILILSMFSGYIVAVKAMSVFAGLRLAVTYFFLLGAAVIDWKLHIIPNFIPGWLILSRLVILGLEVVCGECNISDINNSVLAMLLCMVVLFIADKVSKGGIGKGDIKLLMALGFMCGIDIAFETLLMSLICCTVVSVVLLVTKKCTIKDHLAFGPFIYAGYIAMFLLAV